MTQALPLKIGFWSSLLFTILGFILIAANIGIGFTGQWQAWEGMEAYAAWYASVRVNFFTIAFIASFLMTILFLGIMAVFTNNELLMVLLGGVFVVEALSVITQVIPTRTGEDFQMPLQKRQNPAIL